MPRFVFPVLFALCLAAPAYADCKSAALEALRASPDGYSVYKRISDKAFFRNWIGCKDVQMSLPTAVHESVHFLTAETDAFPLVGGGEVARPHEVSDFYPPSKIAAEFKTGDYSATYLKPGRASSSGDFLYLLDELNAYSHDLNAATDLVALRRDDAYADNRDGLAALMAFTAVYVERAKEREPETWAGLQNPEVAEAIAKIWAQGEAAMSRACGIPRFGMDDKSYIRRFCAPGPQAALAEVIGHAPTCPTACLKADPEQTVSLSPPDVAGRTLWSSRSPRRAAADGG